MQAPIEEIIKKRKIDPEDILWSVILDDTKKEFYVFAWVVNDEIVLIDYGSGDSYMSQKPNIGKADVIYPYTELTEREAYILSKYEIFKFKQLNLKTVNDFGFGEGLI